MAKQSFKKGTLNRKASHKMAEGLKGKYDDNSAFAIATAATKKMSKKGKESMAKKGLKG